MAIHPPGTIVFAGLGSSPMKFHSPSGVELGNPDVGSVICGVGVWGIVALKSSGYLCQVGGGSPTFISTAVGTFKSDLSYNAEYVGAHDSGVGIGRDDAEHFYGVKNGLITQYDADAVETGSWDFGAALGFGGSIFTTSFSVKSDASVAYLATRDGTTIFDRVYKYTIGGAGSLFVTKTGYRVKNRGVLVLDNGEVLIGWDQTPGSGYALEHYDASGALLHSYTLPGCTSPVTLTYGLTSSTVWVGYGGPTIGTFSALRIVELELGTGTILNQWDPDDGASYDYNGPFAVLTQPTGVSTPVILPIPNPTPAAPPTPCTPQSEVGNGGKGNSGCNTGGVGSVQSYTGPFDVAPVHADPTEGETLSGKEHLGIEPYFELVHTDYPSNVVTTYRRAFVELAHDPSFDGGRKPDGLLAIGRISHALGNERGGLEAATVEIEYSGVRDRLIHGLLATQDLAGDEFRIKLGTDQGAALGTPAQVMARARVETAVLTSGLRARLTAVDELFAEDGPFGPSAVYPCFLYGDLGSAAPFMTEDTKRTPIPSLWGEKSDLGGVDPLTGASRAKGRLPGVFLQRFDFPATAAVVAAAPPSTGKTLAQVVAELQASVTAGTTDADWGAIIGSGDAAALEAMGTVPDTYDRLASVIGYSDLDALLAMGTTPAPVSTEWGVLAFGLGPFHAFLSVHASDLGNGDPAKTPDRTTLDLATRAGSDVLVPGWPNWPFADEFLSFTNPDTGRQFDLACILVRGPILDDHLSGKVNITANAVGRRGENDLPLIDVHHAMQAWLEDDILNQRTSGPVVSSATYPQWADGTPKVRSSTFAACQAYTATKVGGRGLRVSWYPSVQRPTVQVAADLMRWTESKLGWDHQGQAVNWRLDEMLSTAAWPLIVHDSDAYGPITRTTGEDRENVTSGSCDWDPDKDVFLVNPPPQTNTTAIARYKNRRKPGEHIENELLVEEAHLLWVLQARAIRLGLGTTLFDVTGKAGWADYKLGTGVLLTSDDGPGPFGYVDHPFVILRRQFDFAAKSVTLTLWDVDDVLLETRFPNGGALQFLISDGGSAPLVTDDSALAPLVLL